jgi:hypothetical protein
MRDKNESEFLKYSFLHSRLDQINWKKGKFECEKSVFGVINTKNTRTL